MLIQWVKDGIGYKSVDGRFLIRRFIRRSGTNWGLIDRVVPREPGTNGDFSTLRKAKEAAQWRATNRPSNDVKT